MQAVRNLPAQHIRLSTEGSLGVVCHDYVACCADILVRAGSARYVCVLQSDRSKAQWRGRPAR